MGAINRSAVIIRPLPPYLAWAKRDDTTDIAEPVFEDLRRAPHVYLLPEYGDADSEREILDDFWPDLFAAMLNCWLTDEQQWPKNRTQASCLEEQNGDVLREGVRVLAQVDGSGGDRPNGSRPHWNRTWNHMSFTRSTPAPSMLPSPERPSCDWEVVERCRIRLYPSFPNGVST